MLPVQSNVEPELVTSPVAIPIVLPVCSAVAVQALPVTLVWSHVLVPERLVAVIPVELIVSLGVPAIVA